MAAAKKRQSNRKRKAKKPVKIVKTAVLLEETARTAKASAKNTDSSSSSHKKKTVRSPATASRSKRLPKHSPHKMTDTQRAVAFTQPVGALGRFLSKHADRILAFFSLCLLIGTTIFWSIMAARIHYGNADQLVDPYLFQDAETFRGAHFPATHTFLLKWPLFALSALLGNTAQVFTILTVVVSLATVLAFAWTLYRVVSRLRAWALLTLGLALVLLLVPAQPAPGTLLPVGFGMLTTRNLEYVLYLCTIYLSIKPARLFGLRALGASLLWALLFLSDRLFVPFALGSLGLLLIFGFAARRPELKRSAVQGLGFSVAGLMVALLGVVLLGQLTHVTYAETASPYALASPKEMLTGFCYAILGTMTNLGLNPAPGETLLRLWPGAALRSLGGVGGIAYLAVFACAAAGFYSIWRSLRRGMANMFTPQKPLDTALQFTIVLAATSVVAGVIFIGTDHYFAGDARYLTIILFASFVAAARLLRTKHVTKRLAFDYSLIVGVALIAATYVAYAGYQDSIAAGRQYTDRNEKIVQVLQQHKVQKLVGDYWRVVPIRALAGTQQAVTPLQSCTEPRDALTSDAWQLKPHESFAYLLSLKKGATDFPPCSLAEVVRHYGRPNGSVLIDGTVESPGELLLFYDRGLPEKSEATSRDDTVGPVSLTSLSMADCPSGTILQVVAHPDDDLLFMSPALLESLDHGACVRTVYITAGDNGAAAYYWVGRQLGAEAAYGSMLGKHLSWQSQPVKFQGSHYATVSSVRDSDKVALIFLNLPDGNVDGSGFSATNHRSLEKLSQGSITSLASVDTQSAYTYKDIRVVMQQIIEVFRPTEIRYLTPEPGIDVADHSDHRVIGQLMSQLLAEHQSAWAGQFNHIEYVGYPGQSLFENVFDDLLVRKQAAFMAYAAHDGGVCQSLEICYEHSAYGAYLDRQYVVAEYQAAYLPIAEEE